MQNIQHIKDKNAVLVPVKDWEKMQKELVRLRKKVNKAKVLSELRTALIDLKNDLARDDYDPANEMSAEEFLAELRNEQ